LGEFFEACSLTREIQASRGSADSSPNLRPSIDQILLDRTVQIWYGAN